MFAAGAQEHDGLADIAGFDGADPAVGIGQDGDLPACHGQDAEWIVADGGVATLGSDSLAEVVECGTVVDGGLSEEAGIGHGFGDAGHDDHFGSKFDGEGG